MREFKVSRKLSKLFNRKLRGFKIIDRLQPHPDFKRIKKPFKCFCARKHEKSNERIFCIYSKERGLQILSKKSPPHSKKKSEYLKCKFFYVLGIDDSLVLLCNTGNGKDLLFNICPENFGEEPNYYDQNGRLLLNSGLSFIELKADSNSHFLSSSTKGCDCDLTGGDSLRLHDSTGGEYLFCEFKEKLLIINYSAKSFLFIDFLSMENLEFVDFFFEENYLTPEKENQTFFVVISKYISQTSCFYTILRFEFINGIRTTKMFERKQIPCSKKAELLCDFKKERVLIFKNPLSSGGIMIKFYSVSLNIILEFFFGAVKLVILTSNHVLIMSRFFDGKIENFQLYEIANEEIRQLHCYNSEENVNFDQIFSFEFDPPLPIFTPLIRRYLLMREEERVCFTFNELPSSFEFSKSLLLHVIRENTLLLYRRNNFYL